MAVLVVELFRFDDGSFFLGRRCHGLNLDLWTL